MEEKCKDIMTYCKKLSKLEQEVVQYTLDDYSPKEIANKIGINEKQCIMRCIVVRKNCLDSLNTIDENATYFV